MLYAEYEAAEQYCATAYSIQIWTLLWDKTIFPRRKSTLPFEPYANQKIFLGKFISTLMKSIL